MVKKMVQGYSAGTNPQRRRRQKDDVVQEEAAGKQR
jgi:hypothetical protein